MQPTNSQSGFTVLEALVALAILTGVTASILILLSSLRAAQLNSRLRLASAFQAQTLLNRVGRDIPLESGIRTGTFMDGRKWSIAIQPFVSDVALERARSHVLYDVRVLVGVTNDSSRDFELRTLIRDVP